MNKPRQIPLAPADKSDQASVDDARAALHAEAAAFLKEMRLNIRLNRLLHIVLVIFIITIAVKF